MYRLSVQEYLSYLLTCLCGPYFGVRSEFEPFGQRSRHCKSIITDESISRTLLAYSVILYDNTKPFIFRDITDINILGSRSI